MPTYSLVLAQGNDNLNAASPAWPKGARRITNVRLVGGAAASIVNLYDSAVSPPAVTHAATVTLAQGAKENDYGFMKYRTTPISQTAVPEFDASVILVPPGSAPAEPTTATPTDASNYISSTGVPQRNQYPGSRQTSTVVNENAAAVPSLGTFTVAIAGQAQFPVDLSVIRGLVANATEICTLIVDYDN